MRRTTVNRNVLKAMTIGIAAVIATTSVPMNVYAAENDPVDGNNQSGEQGQGGETTQTQAPEIDVVTAAEVADDVTVTEEAQSAVEAAIDVVDDYTELNAKDSEVIDDLKEADDLLKGENLSDDNLNVALVQSEVASQNLDDLEESLNSVYLKNSDKDHKGDDRLQYDVERDQDGNLIVETDANGNEKPVIDGSQAVTQISGQYNSANDNNKRSTQGVYQDGMKEIQAAIKDRENGNEAGANAHLDKAATFLAASTEKLADSDKELKEAWAQYTAAADAAQAANEALANAKNVSGAIYDSKAAEAKLEAAQKKADKLAAISQQYYAVMVEYFKNDSKTLVLDDEGKLDAGLSAQAARNTNTKQVNVTEGITNDTWNYGRGLFNLLINYKLEEEGATDIKIGTQTGDEAATAEAGWYLKSQAGTIVSVSSDGKTTKSSTGNQTWVKKTDTKVNGRDTRIKVTYTDDNGDPQTKYYNYICKAKADKYEGANVDLENGVIYVAEVTYDEETKTWDYAKYNPDGSVFLDNYNLTKDYTEAKEKVAAAAAEVKKLRAEVEAIETKVSDNNTRLTDLKTKLDKAQEAYDASKQSLQDFQDVYDLMMGNYVPKQIGEADIVLPSDDTVTDDTVITTDDTIDDTTADTDDTFVPADDAADDAADDGDVTPGTVIDAGGVTVTVPGMTLPAGFAFNAGGVAVNGGGAVVDAVIEDGGVPLAESVEAPETVKKENKVNKIKNIKDNKTPLANDPIEQGAKMSWWWLLIIFLLGATGKKMYDEYQKKQEEKAAAVTTTSSDK